MNKILVTEANKIINGTSEDDSINNGNIYNIGFDNVTIKTGSGDDTVISRGSKVFIDTGEDNDFIINGYQDNFNENVNTTIMSGSGNDTIYSHSSYTTINAGMGDDYLKISGSYITVKGGAGADTISIGEGSNNVIQYAEGDGKDIIYGYNSNDTLQITSGIYSTTKSGDDLIINVGSDSIILKKAASKNLNIIGMATADTTSSDLTYNKTKTAVTVGSDFNGTLKSSDYATTIKKLDGSQTSGGVWLEGNNLNNSVIGGSGDDTLTGGGGTDKLYGGDGTDVFIYRDGDGKDTIYDYEAGERLIVVGVVDSIKTSGSNVLVYVGKDRVTVKNTKEKPLTWIDSDGKSGSQTYTEGVMYFSDSTESSGKAKTGIYTLDASSRTKGIKLTGNAKANTLIGGSGDDTLKGGSGVDTFIYSAGNDTITDYTAKDVINLNSAINSVTARKKDIIFNTDSGTLTVKNGKGKDITLTDASGQTTTQKYNSSSYVLTDNSEPWFVVNDRFSTSIDNNLESLIENEQTQEYHISAVQWSEQTNGLEMKFANNERLIIHQNVDK